MAPLSVHIPAYFYPALPSVAARRSGEVARFFAARKTYVHVSSSNYMKLYGTPVEFPAPHLIPVFDYRYFSVSSDHFHPPGGALGNTGYSTFGKLTNSFPSNLIFGQGAWLYILQSYRYHKALMQQSDGKHLIFTSFRTWADIYVGYLLKKKFPEAIWWSDWRDAPFDPTFKNYFSRRAQMALLSSVLAKADLITGVSQGVLDAIGAGQRHNAHLVRNGFIPLTLKPTSPAALTDRITPFVAYTGSLYGENNDPKIVFEAIKKTENINVVYAGKDSTVWQQFAERYGISDRSIALGVVSPTEARWLQENSLANLLLTYAAPGYTGDVSMKIYEYLASGKPILCSHVGPRDAEISELVQESKSPCLMAGQAYATVEQTKLWLNKILLSQSAPVPNVKYSFQVQLQKFYDEILHPKIQKL